MSASIGAAQPDTQGRDAVSPWHMPFKAWVAVAKRTWLETTNDNIGLIAAGVAFYGFLALVPLLGAIVLVYGIAATPSTVMRNMTQLTSVMPSDVAKLVGEQLMNVVRTSDGKKGFGLLLALVLAVFGARNGAGAVITALNIAYDEDEKRSFLTVNLLAIAMTATAIVVAMIALAAIAALGSFESLVPNASNAMVVGGKAFAYFLLTLTGAGTAATLYRFGPSRQQAKWVWLTPGSIFAALTGLVLTIGFSIYVAEFGNYNVAYGSLSTVMVTLTWLYLSSYILLFGAELNAELEHQTTQDTTKLAAPVGERGAWVADHVAEVGEPEDTKQGADDTGRATGTASRLSGIKSLAAGRAGARAGTFAGLPKIGWGSSIAATVGLSMLRRGLGAQGAMLLVATAALTWVSRPRPRNGDLTAETSVLRH